ncbi:MAG TPA: hypothetical protein VL068_01365 [Microthrixaceae bacterium]|nr:hypothetical protein [Microthrixaceae bacterium]
MKSCPGCLFLIDDDQERCDTCMTHENSEFHGSIGQSGSQLVGQSGGGTALLEAPTTVKSAVATEHAQADVRYRSTRRILTVKSAAICVLIVVVGGALASAAGYGPLAPRFVLWNLTFNRPEAFPQQWDHLDDLSAVFEVDLPGGSETLFESLDPDNSARGGIVGKTVDTVRGAKMQVAWSGFGMSPEALSGLDSEAGLETLLGQYAEIRIAGEMTVARPVVLPFGQAVDAVFVEQGASTEPDAADTSRTTRVRMVMTPKEVFILSTSGPDGDSEALDAAHQRLLESFKPNL